MPKLQSQHHHSHNQHHHNNQSLTTNLDSLVLNYKAEDIVQIDNLLPSWTATWRKFETDILSYILPAIGQDEQQPEPTDQNSNTISMPGTRQQKHTFSFAQSTRALKHQIAIHSNLDIFTQIRKEITRIFYKIANLFISHALNPTHNLTHNLAHTLVCSYQKLSPKLSILLGCLTLVLNKFITRKGIEQEIYSIFNKELVNHHGYEKYVGACLAEVEGLRNGCIAGGRLGEENKGLGQCQSESEKVLENIRILNRMKIFPYIEYIQRSKKYYSQLIPNLPKNLHIFPTLHNLTKLEKSLEHTITPNQQQIQHIKKLLKNQGWRTLQQQTMLKVFCKEVLEEIYEDLIQYLDYLVELESYGDKDLEREGKGNEEMKDEGNVHGKIEYVLTLEEKKDMLRYLWQLTKILQKHYPIQPHHQKYHTNPQKFANMDKKSNQNITPSQKLLNRLTTIISDLKKYIKSTTSSNIHVTNDQKQKQKLGSQNMMYKIIDFRDHIFAIIAQCFENDSKFLNAITIKIEKAILQEQQAYNANLCDIILSPLYKFPHNNPHEKQMQDQNQQQHITTNSTTLSHNNRTSFQLYKLTPSKQQFIRKFEQQFSHYVLLSPTTTSTSTSTSNPNLTHQQYFIKSLQKQSGHSLSRNIERMIADVWRSGEDVYYRNGKIVCRVLCHDWMHFGEAKWKLVDGLVGIRDQFQGWFLGLGENQKKKLKWIEELGKIVISISGTECTFSQLQASIILLLSKSYRPIKSSQFIQVLASTSSTIEPILSTLTASNILIHSPQTSAYELNYQNIIPYTYSHSYNKIDTLQKKKIPLQKDYIYIIQACIARILKRRKWVQKTDILRIVGGEMKIDSHQVTIEEINTSLERLEAKNIVSIDKSRGVVKYCE